MGILEKLGLTANAAAGKSVQEGDTETVRRIVAELESLETERARYIAAFAFILSRVANADLEISVEETPLTLTMDTLKSFFRFTAGTSLALF